MILIPRFKYSSHLFSWDCWQIITSLNFKTLINCGLTILSTSQASRKLSRALALHVVLCGTAMWLFKTTPPKAGHSSVLWFTSDWGPWHQAQRREQILQLQKKPRNYLRACKNTWPLCIEFLQTNDIRPAQQAAIFLATYDFTNANKLFGYHLISAAPENSNEESPFATFLSVASYLLQHAYRSERVSHYAELNLFTLRILTEDPSLCKLLCSTDEKRKVRLCRQRQPYLPTVTGDRVLATAIFDIMIDVPYSVLLVRR